MFKKLTPLKTTDHADLRLLPVTDYGFARTELVAPIVIDEIADVAREFPIVFPEGAALPAALMGVEKDSNAYVGANGQWLAHYVPAHIRQYPLLLVNVAKLAESAEGEASTQTRRAAKTKAKSAKAAPANAPETRLVLLVDEESPCVSRTQGEPVFNEKGELNGLAEQNLRMMNTMRARAVVTQQLVKAIDDAGLLVERSIRIQRQGEPDRQVAGVRVIDEAALNKLDDAAFNTLRKAGALPLVYASLLSWANFRQGQIGKSHPLPAPSASAAAVTADDDLIRFN